jgi:pilus assembly protein Flp/PilA
MRKPPTVVSSLSTRKKANEISSNHKTIRSKNMIRKFFRDETGLELSEYAVAAALVAIAVVVAFTALGTAISSKINTLAATING